MLTCKDVCDDATRLLDENTGLVERIGLRIHLLMCKECRRFIRQFKLMTGAASALGEVDAPTDDEIDALVNQLASRREP